MPRTPPSRRERPAKSPLSREAVVKAALQIVKKEGLEKATMRRVAAALETGPASLYVYVRDTTDLHAQILDALLANLPAPKPGPHWHDDLMRVCEAFLDVLMRFPAIARMTMATHATGPNSVRLLDTVAGLLIESGAEVRSAAWGVDMVLAYVIATAVEHAGRERGDEFDLEDLRQVVNTLDPKTHPHLAELSDELLSGEGAERFRFGLNVLVNGLLRTVG